VSAIILRRHWLNYKDHILMEEKEEEDEKKKKKKKKNKNKNNNNNNNKVKHKINIASVSETTMAGMP
jgi:mannitol-specific phosphotransferase system IIBC component